MSPLQKILMWTGVVMTGIFSIAVVVIGIYFYTISGLITVIKDQLASIQAGDAVTAYSYTSTDFQQATSLDNFKKFIERYPVLKNHVNSAFYERDVKNGIGAVIGRLQAENGSITPIEYRLVKEKNKWKIVAIQISPAELTPSTIQTTGNSKSTSAIALSNIYEDKNSKFSINYPADWTYEQPEKAAVIIGGKKGTPAFESSVNIQTILTQQSGGVYRNLKQFVNSIKKQANELSSDVKIISEGPIDAPKTPDRMPMHGRYLYFTYTYHGQKFQQLQFVFLRDDGQAFYAWGYTAPADRYQLDYTTAKAMFATWAVY